MAKTSKNRGRKNKTVKIRHFKDLKQQKIAKKGVQISFEKASSLGEGEKPKGDIVKKYVNGKLVAQKFVTEAKLKQLVKKHARVHGGKSKTNNPPTTNNPVGKDPTGKDPAGNQQVIVVQDGTNMKQSFASGLGHGIGFGIGFEVVKGVVNGIFGSDD